MQSNLLRIALVSVLSILGVITSFGLEIESPKIFGTVKDTAGVGVSNLTVQAFNTVDCTNTTVSGTTDLNGNFSLGVFDGLWQVALSSAELNARGYRPVFSQAITISGTNGTVDFVIKPAIVTAHLRGQVVDQKGNAINNISVSASGTEGSFSAKTDAEGNFDFGVFGGNWRLKVDDFEAKARGVVAPGLSVSTSDGRDENGIRLVAFRPTARILGSLKDNTDSSIAGVYIFAFGALNGADYVLSGVTDANGEFRLDAFDGQWELYVSSYDLTTRHYRMAAEEHVTISGGDQVVSMVAEKVITTAHLRGRAVDGAGQALAGLAVFASSSSGDFLQAQTNADGNFDFDVFGGLWSLRLENSQALCGFITSSLNVPVVDGVDVNDIVLAAYKPDRQLIGAVKDSAGNPVPGMRLSASANANNTIYSVFASTDGEGNYRLGLFNALWHVSLTASDLSARGYRQTAERTVTTSSPETELNFVVVPAPLRETHVRGRVIDDTGAALSFVGLLATSGDTLLPIHTGADGSFDFGLNGGTWKLKVDETEAAARGVVPLIIEINITEGLDQADVVLVTPRANASITGTVRDAQGKPLSDLSVAASVQANGTNYYASSLTEADGEFHLPVFNHQWQVSLSTSDLNARRLRDPGTRIVTVAGGEQVLEFQVEPISSENPAAPSLRLNRTSAGQFQLQISSQTDFAFHLEASTDLLTWLTVFTGRTQDGSFTVTHGDAPEVGHRFYRVVTGR